MVAHQTPPPKPRASPPARIYKLADVGMRIYIPAVVVSSDLDTIVVKTDKSQESTSE